MHQAHLPRFGVNRDAEELRPKLSLITDIKAMKTLDKQNNIVTIRNMRYFVLRFCRTTNWQFVS